MTVAPGGPRPGGPRGARNISDTFLQHLSD